MDFCKIPALAVTNDIETQIPRFSGRALYGCRVYIVSMTRKDKMKEGFVARTFHLPQDIDDQLRMMAIKDHVRFSEMAILAFREHISRVKGDGK